MAPRGYLESLATESVKFFRLLFLVHITCACVILGLGIAAAVATDGSSGSSSVPYYFNAFICGCWQLALLVVAVVCGKSMSHKATLIRRAIHWVKAYLVVSSVFIIFNMVGVVFCVVYGLCLEGQQCYYSVNMALNRGIAITIIGTHSVFMVVSIIASKRAHVIESNLNSDIAVRLGHDYDLDLFGTMRSARHRSRASTIGSADSLCSDSSSESDEEGQKRNVFLPSNKPVHQSATRIHTIPQAAIFQVSKSNPNLKRRSESLGAEELEGTLVSIYSDSEMKRDNVPNQTKRKVFRNRTRSNKVTPEKTVDNATVGRNDVYSTSTKKHMLSGNETSTGVMTSSLSATEGTSDESQPRRHHKRGYMEDPLAVSNSVTSLGGSDENAFVMSTEGQPLVRAGDGLGLHLPAGATKELLLQPGAMVGLQLQLQQQQDELQRRQMEVLEKQERLLRDQQRLELAASPPPPYRHTPGPLPDPPYRHTPGPPLDPPYRHTPGPPPDPPSADTPAPPAYDDILPLLAESEKKEMEASGESN